MARNGSLRIEFAVTPRFDVFYALYTITSSARTPLESWKAKARRRLPRDFERVTNRVAPLPIFWPLLADAIQGVPGEVSFEEMLSTIREMRVDDLKRNILSGIFHDRETVDALVVRKSALGDVLADEKLPGAELLTHFGLKPYDPGSPASRTMNALLSRPQSYRDELGLVLQAFWETGFRQDWAALEPGLRSESFRMRDLQEERSSAELGHELNLPVTLDDSAKEIRPKTGPAIAYELARTPTTSAELARSLNVSKPTITHHVHALRSAGLISETPSRGSTMLSLSRDTVAALSGAAVEQLFSSTGALTLGTTRKRRS